MSQEEKYEVKSQSYYLTTNFYSLFMETESEGVINNT